MNRSTRTAMLATALAAATLPATAAHAGDGPVGIVFHAALTGSEVPDGGDPKGTGKATLRLVPDTNEVCWDISWSGLSGSVTGIHLHHGGPGETGPHAVDMVNDATLPGSGGSNDGCTTLGEAQGAPHEHTDAPAAPMGGGGHQHSRGLQIFNAHSEPTGGSDIDAIVAEPEHYYVQVHSTAYPKGAIRGQLGG